MSLDVSISSVKVERLDDIPFLIGMMVRMDLPTIIDEHIPRRKGQRDLSWGWTAVIWLSYIISSSDHRKVVVVEFISLLKESLESLTNQKICEADFSDDRLSNLLSYLYEEKVVQNIEHNLSQSSISVYDLPCDVVRCDATTVSGYHSPTATGVFQFGHSKDDPSLAQIKVMISSLDPLGMPLMSEVVSGEKADDGLYCSTIERTAQAVNKRGVLYVGDSKMSSFDSCFGIDSHADYYLCPLSLVGTRKASFEEWVSYAIDHPEELTIVHRTSAKGEEKSIGEGYEVTYTQTSSPKKDKADIRTLKSRVFVMKSFAHAERQEAGLKRRLSTAEEKIRALTPPRKRGVSQMRESEKLEEAIQKILKEQRVEGLLSYQYEKEVEEKVQYVGRGRGSKDRKQKIIKRVRYQITTVVLKKKEIAQMEKTFGWQAYITNAPTKRLSVTDAFLCYRDQYKVERVFNRLKSQLNIAPFFVTKEEQIKGLTSLLMIGVRVLTLTEYIVRESLQKENIELENIYPENKKKKTQIPTVERILKAFEQINVTVITIQKTITRHITPLSALQKQLLKAVGIEWDIYQKLEIKNTHLRLSE